MTMCMIQSVSIMSCSVDLKAHAVASVRAPSWCKPLETADLTRDDGRQAVRFPQAFPQFL